MGKTFGERRPYRAPQNTSRGRDIHVKTSNTLLAFLLETLKEQSRTSIKSLLSHGQIQVNDKTVRQFDTPVTPGDTVRICFERTKAPFSNPLLNIIWEDDDLIVINKREGLLSVATQREKERTAYHILGNYLKKIDPQNKIFILHRLDRETSGLMMFAKKESVKRAMQDNWSEMITQRSYVAVVEGRPQKDTDLLISNLVENKKMQVYVVPVGTEGKEAITRYRLLKTNNAYSLLELDLETGRKNQIRAQLQSVGLPIAGDFKYGAETNPTGRLMLHARKLCFIHPTTGEEMRFETHIPDKFISLTK